MMRIKYLFTECPLFSEDHDIHLAPTSSLLVTGRCNLPSFSDVGEHHNTKYITRRCFHVCNIYHVFVVGQFGPYKPRSVGYATKKRHSVKRSVSDRP